MKIGHFTLSSPVLVAPMAGITDKPFRKICKENGAGMVVGEMVTSKEDLQKSQKTQWRMDVRNEQEPVAIQIVGTDPKEMADAARRNVDAGAQIIDINMGCPAKKVCKKMAGSALLAQPDQVAQILDAVVNAVEVPVSLKIRTGINPEQRNGVEIARIAEDAGIQSLAVHGRTRACKFNGHAEYNTIGKIKQAVSIPVVANGDITTPEQAKTVLAETNADAVMLGRAVQGQPWLLQQTADHLNNITYHEPSLAQKTQIICDHLQGIYAFYGEFMGVRFARKHIKWYLQHWPIAMPQQQRAAILATNNCSTQLRMFQMFLRDSCSNDIVINCAA